MKTKQAITIRGFTLVELLVVMAIIAGLAAVSTPVILRQIARTRATTAINNMKDIRVAIQAFAERNNGNAPAFDTDANITFRSLFVVGVCRDEKPYYVAGVQSVPGAREGDDNMSPSNILEQGENVFSYFQNNSIAPNMITDDANTPIVGIPLLDQSNIYDATFEFGSFGGQAVILRTDGSAVTYSLEPVSANSSLEGGTLLNPDGTSYDPPSSTGAPNFSNHTAQGLPTGHSPSGT